MVKGCLIFLIAGSLLACNDSASVSITVDSTGKKFEDKAEKVWDSTKEGLKDLKEKVNNRLDKLDSTLDAKRDSFRKKKI